jgi:hypothetical protein
MVTVTCKYGDKTDLPRGLPPVEFARMLLREMHEAATRKDDG